ncbi:Hypothetical predicted protein [Marmota monax]|uniref:Uncharacterized protein n=1 Tax=Marmota monax TaxID=9995 RepID=A0A5E4AZI9_MARMO|nr:Hypothetical predicted protein [Marmota monax]
MIIRLQFDVPAAFLSDVSHEVLMTTSKAALQVQLSSSSVGSGAPDILPPSALPLDLFFQRQVQEKEKLYVELKHILARQPGPEAAEQLQIYRHTLREKTKQLKVLSSELNMYESQSQEYKYEIEKLGNELMNLKKKYLAQKRKELILKNKNRIPVDNSISVAEPTGPRFTGGGFPLSKTSKTKS